MTGKVLKVAAWERAKALAKARGDDSVASSLEVYEQLERLDATPHPRYTETRVRLALFKGELESFRCGGCGTLLLKGQNLEQSLIEVKCRKCGAFNLNR